MIVRISTSHGHLPVYFAVSRFDRNLRGFPMSSETFREKHVMNASAASGICMRRCIVSVFALAALVLQGGCANYQTRIADGKPLHQQYESGKMDAYLWGNWVSPEIMSAEDCKNGIYDVVVENNYLYSLATVVTLGIWMPIDVSFRCKAPGAVDGGVVPP